MKVVGIIQASLGSKRLAYKTLQYVGRLTVLEHVIKAVQQAKLDDMIVVTRGDLANVAIVELCQELNIRCIWSRIIGYPEPKQVLREFVMAAAATSADYVVRVCADNPHIEPRYINLLVEAARNSRPDYCSFRTDLGRPVIQLATGLYAEVISTVALNRILHFALFEDEHEHVTLAAYSSGLHSYRCTWLPLPEPLGESLAVDTHEDLERIRNR